MLQPMIALGRYQAHVVQPGLGGPSAQAQQHACGTVRGGALRAGQHWTGRITGASINIAAGERNMQGVLGAKAGQQSRRGEIKRRR